MQKLALDDLQQEDNLSLMNGADDVFVLLGDMLCLKLANNGAVLLVPNTGYCSCLVLQVGVSRYRLRSRYLSRSRFENYLSPPPPPPRGGALTDGPGSIGCWARPTPPPPPPGGGEMWLPFLSCNGGTSFERRRRQIAFEVVWTYDGVRSWRRD
eukprot:jgi/Botrbrau1/18631/Bobra.0367s0067.1